MEPQASLTSSQMMVYFEALCNIIGEKYILTYVIFHHHYLWLYSSCKVLGRLKPEVS
jgi:hypothetical protein